MREVRRRIAADPADRLARIGADLGPRSSPWRSSMPAEPGSRRVMLFESLPTEPDTTAWFDVVPAARARRVHAGGRRSGPARRAGRPRPGGARRRRRAGPGLHRRRPPARAGRRPLRPVPAPPARRLRHGRGGVRRAARRRPADRAPRRPPDATSPRTPDPRPPVRSTGGPRRVVLASRCRAAEPTGRWNGRTSPGRRAGGRGRRLRSTGGRSRSAAATSAGGRRRRRRRAVARPATDHAAAPSVQRGRELEGHRDVRGDPHDGAGDGERRGADGPGRQVPAPPVDHLARPARIRARTHERSAGEAADREPGVPIPASQVDVLEDLGAHRAMTADPRVVLGAGHEAWTEGDGRGRGTPGERACAHHGDGAAVRREALVRLLRDVMGLDREQSAATGVLVEQTRPTPAVPARCRRRGTAGGCRSPPGRRRGRPTAFRATRSAARSSG